MYTSMLECVFTLSRRMYNSWNWSLLGRTRRVRIRNGRVPCCLVSGVCIIIKNKIKFSMVEIKKNNQHCLTIESKL